MPDHRKKKGKGWSRNCSFLAPSTHTWERESFIISPKEWPLRIGLA